MRRINAIVVLAIMLPALGSFAAPESKSDAAKKGDRQVTVTLVRWPYT